MSLTKADLQSIKQLLDSSIDERVPQIIDERVPAIIDGRVQPMLDRLEERAFKRLTRLEARLTDKIAEVEDSVTRQAANAFAEVHTKIDGIYGELNVIQMSLRRIEKTEQHRPRRATLKS